MKIWHMNGAGNDFLVLDARNLTLDFAALSKKLCEQTGADGFMALDVSAVADFRLHFYNSDGSRGEMCGNGSRCICRFAFEHGLAGEEMVIETDAGLVPGQRLTEREYLVQLNTPTVLDRNRKNGVAYVELGCPGSPHAVVEMPGLSWDDRDALRQQAQQLRFDSAFPKGANVNFYTWLGDGHIRILTYERGVEDYTLACGTGTGSTAALLWASGQLPGGQLRADNPGGTLHVTVEGENGQISKLLLQGPTEVAAIYDMDIA